MKFTIQTPANDFKKSSLFYTKLNFKSITETLFTDGIACIEICKDAFARPSLKCYLNNDFSIIKQLEKVTTILEKKDYFLIALPSGTWIYLNKNDIELPQKETNSFAVLGNYTGVSIETISIAKEKEILELLGFKPIMGDASQGWVILKNDNDFRLSLMAPNACPHLFTNPALTYFNGKEKNPKIIQKIRNLNIPIAQEITHFSKDNTIDNIILQDNGGLNFFIFND